jgi:hypothetical protein
MFIVVLRSRCRTDIQKRAKDPFYPHLKIPPQHSTDNKNTILCAHVKSPQTNTTFSSRCQLSGSSVRAPLALLLPPAPFQSQRPDTFLAYRGYDVSSPTTSTQGVRTYASEPYKKSCKTPIWTRIRSFSSQGDFSPRWTTTRHPATVTNTGSSASMPKTVTRGWPTQTRQGGRPSSSRNPCKCIFL